MRSGSLTPTGSRGAARALCSRLRRLASVCRLASAARRGALTVVEREQRVAEVRRTGLARRLTRPSTAGLREHASVPPARKRGDRPLPGPLVDREIGTALSFLKERAVRGATGARLPIAPESFPSAAQRSPLPAREPGPVVAPEVARRDRAGTWAARRSCWRRSGATRPSSTTSRRSRRTVPAELCLERRPLQRLGRLLLLRARAPSCGRDRMIEVGHRVVDSAARSGHSDANERADRGHADRAIPATGR